jgi:hypothetical protein
LLVLLVQTFRPATANSRSRLNLDSAFMNKATNVVAPNCQGDIVSAVWINPDARFTHVEQACRQPSLWTEIHQRSPLPLIFPQEALPESPEGAISVGD